MCIFQHFRISSRNIPLKVIQGHLPFSLNGCLKSFTYFMPWILKNVSSFKTYGDMLGQVNPLGNWCNTTTSFPAAFHFICKFFSRYSFCFFKNKNIKMEINSKLNSRINIVSKKCSHYMLYYVHCKIRLQFIGRIHLPVKLVAPWLNSEIISYRFLLL